MEPDRNNPFKKPPGDPDGENNKPKTNGWVALTIAILVVLAFSTIFNAVSNSQYTSGAFSGVKCRREPKLCTRRQFLPMSQRMISISWQDFCRSMGLVSPADLQLPRTKLWA